jgi:hypothetical protein
MQRGELDPEHRRSRTVKSTLSTRPPTPAVSVTVTVSLSEP